jgi:hypothetical protein
MEAKVYLEGKFVPSESRVLRRGEIDVVMPALVRTILKYSHRPSSRLNTINARSIHHQTQAKVCSIRRGQVQLIFVAMSPLSLSRRLDLIYFIDCSHGFIL